MIIFPAIDLKDGKCVRLFKGEEGTETVFSENPGDIAFKWEESGARWSTTDGRLDPEPANA